MAPHPLRRRLFLQGSGGLLLVVGAGLAPSGCSESDSALGPWRMLVADPALCGGCARCAITCSSLHEAGFGPNDALTGPDPIYQARFFDDPYWYPATCRMCLEQRQDGAVTAPACVVSCPQGAAQIARPGDPTFGELPIRFIDPDLCIGCGACAEACPHQHPLLIAGQAYKCDLCIGRFDKPACVEECPASALWVIDFYSDKPPRPFPWVLMA